MKGLYRQLARLAAAALVTAAAVKAQQRPEVLQIDVKGNTALGAQALLSDTTGALNTAAGQRAMLLNTTGSFDSAFGYNALALNLTGSDNAAFGIDALASNVAGSDNTSAGFNSLYLNTTGNGNTAIGIEALYSNTTGSRNIALGAAAGYALTSGVNDIEIGNLGIAGESNTVRIGTAGAQKRVYIAGIGTSPVAGSAVYISSQGQLGVLESSERFKRGILPMAAQTRKLQQLHPVTFYYRSDPGRVLQYGLIAEDVERVYPEMVLHDESGRPQGVRYDELASMLLREFQLQQRRIVDQSLQLSELRRQVARLQEPGLRDPAAAAGAGAIGATGAIGAPGAPGAFSGSHLQ